MKPKFYVTTPIYYINAEPHIGSAYTTIIADIIARYKRFRGYDVFFLTGTDEHGQKVLNAAQEAGKSPQEFCDELAEKFKKLWEDLEITNDYFIRTTDELHMKVVQRFVEKIKENGDIYKGKYEGWYCVPCESFWNEDELGENKTCPSCGRKVRWVSEENYFFRLSKYNQRLLEIFQENPNFVEPDFRRNEMLRILEKGLKDISITRTSFKWGVPMPGDSDHVIYVWVDALINYVSAIGYTWDEEKFNRYWPADLHLIGKEINRFHSLIWPAMLMSVGLPLPKKIYAHGWLTFNGQKISKSLGNAIDPRVLVEKYGLDAIRYYLLREINFGKDGDFSEDNLIGRINADLANDLGNLLHRTTAMIAQNFDSKIPQPSKKESVDNQLILGSLETIQKFFENMDNLRFTQALEQLWQFISLSNKYIDLTEPWKLSKIAVKDRLATVLYNLAESLRIIATLLKPIMPRTSKEIYLRLGIAQEWEETNDKAVEKWGKLKPGMIVKHGKPLFPRIDIKKFEKITATKFKEEVKMVTEELNIITIEDFSKVELRVGEVLEAEKIEKSEKLLKLKVDLGELGERQIVAGIAKHYSPEELIGKLIIVVANLKPAKLMGIESQGMLLAAKDGGKLKILTVDGSLKPGAKVS
ncbi:MAG TPA: methionine--tRNA ligase [Thermotogaceae bacterium]|nr:methionine--tRNA ligase [Thermotogaceae bacterium]